MGNAVLPVRKCSVLEIVGLWLEGIQLRPEMDNEINFLPVRLCFINVYTYPNPKPTPYNNEKIAIIVVQ